MAGAMSLREKAVLAGLGVFVLYALTVVYFIFAGRAQWTAAAKKYNDAKAKYERERRVISERALWDRRYEEEASLIPVVDDGKGADTAWMRVIGDIASTNFLFVSTLKASGEREMEDMKQTTVDMTWNGAFESLVKFMWEIENTDRGKFDIQSLSFSQGKAKGYLSGNMTLNCIFKRK